MPEIACPIEGCPYKTPDVEGVVAATLITTHATPTTHMSHAGDGTSAKVEKVKRPTATISSAGTSEVWAYFTSRWTDYVEATYITGKVNVIQLLECCDEPRTYLAMPEAHSLTLP